MKIQDILIGSDPEFGITLDSMPASVIGKLGGSKKEPMDIGNGCGLQEDNVMAELTMPPCSSKEQFIGYFNYGKQKIEEILLKNTSLPYKAVSISSAEYNSQILNNKTAMTFGCEPSWCIYTKDISFRPEPQDVGNLRSAGFHIHIGIPKLLNIKQRIKLIFCMDLMLGVPSILIDTDEKRRTLYGNAGDFRAKLIPDKDYTIVEYRTLGGAMHATDELIGWCYDQTLKAVQMWLDFSKVEDICKAYDIVMEEVQMAIDTGNTQLCENLIYTTNTTLPNERVFIR